MHAKWLYSGKVVVIEPSCCIRAIRLYSGKNGYVRSRWLYSGKSGSIQVKVVVFGQRWL